MNTTTIDRFALIDLFSVPAPSRRELRREKRFSRFDELFERAKELGAYLERETGPGYRYTVDLSIVEGGEACCATLDEVEEELRDLARIAGRS